LILKGGKKLSSEHGIERRQGAETDIGRKQGVKHDIKGGKS
jgi:hypothetical protein